MKKRMMAMLLAVSLAVGMQNGLVLAAGDNAEAAGMEENDKEVLEEAAAKNVRGVKIIDKGKCGPNLRYQLDANGVLRISGTGTMYSYASTSAPWDEKTVKEVIIESRVTSIGDKAFNGCSSLTSVTIPGSVTNIGFDVFDGTPWLSEKRNKSPLVIVNHILIDAQTASGRVEIPADVTEILLHAFKGSEVSSVIIPEGVTSIGAFSGCSRLTSVTIPGSVTSIGRYAFSGCSRLTSVTIAEGVTSIDEYAFSGCSRLTSVTIPGSVTSIDDWAFYDCSSLTSVTIPGSVTSIDDWAFSGCSSLTSVTIAEGVTSIGRYVFYDCSSLTSVTIPGSVWSIGEYAFNGCSSLTSVTIPEGVTSIGKYAFNGCSSLTSVTIPEGVVYISSGSFSKCGLTSVTIPGSVTSIGGWAFYDCSSLTSVTISEGVTSISDGAFNYCQNLKGVAIPESVTSIGEGAFWDCFSLTDVYYAGTEAQWYRVKKDDKNQALRYATIHYNYRKECTHAKTTIINKKVATFTKNGSITTKCTVCGTTTTKIIYAPKTIKVSKTTCTYNGKNQKPAITVKDSKGKTISSKYYTVSYKNCKNIGEATATVTFKGNYKGTKKLTYEIAPKNTSSLQVGAKSKGFTVKWKKQSSQTTGYQIQYSTSSKFKGAKTLTIKNNRTTSYTAKKLKAGQKYYVRIRTYKKAKVGGKYQNIYSTWSKVKTVTTRK